MTEPVALSVGRAVVMAAFRRFQSHRDRRRQATTSLIEQLNLTFPDNFARRRFTRQLEDLTDTVAQRLDPLCQHELAGLSDSERRAALDAVVDTLAAADFSDAALLSDNADPVQTAQRLRASLPDIVDRAALSEPARRLYDAVLEESCVCLVQLLIHLPAFTPRATAELLERTAHLASQLEQLLERLPVRSLEASVDVDHDRDADFTHRYLTYLSTTLDYLELLGVDVRNYRPRTTLSVAYISLSVSTDAQVRRRVERELWEPGALRLATWECDTPSGGIPVRVEQALTSAPRTLLRGEAGSGKSTLLRWLAVTAARRAFTGALADWNGCVPLLVKLRSHPEGPPRPERMLDGIADPIVGLMPPGWVHRLLESGQALLLVDGVDEVPASQRPAVRTWVRELLAAYPTIRVIVTSRPAAAHGRWLAAEGFSDAMLEPMSPADIAVFIAHWHAAVRDAELPCDPTELSEYERTLRARLDANPHLRGLAANPLLCAMLCALNLDRRTQLPRDRMGLYRAATELLLERRDAERRIPTDVRLEGRDAIVVLRYLAWKMSLNSRSEISREQAVEWLRRLVAGMPHLELEPEVLLSYLLERSGVIRLPVPDRIDFVHRTFQEYLTALEAADNGDAGLLVEKAGSDQWRDIIVMAVGAANVPMRREIVTGILDKIRRHDGANNKGSTRRLKLLLAACLETVPTWEPALRAEVERCYRDLIPPRSKRETRSLAAVGEPLLRHLPRDLGSLTDAQAAATVRTAALVNGPDAYGLLARYATDPRHAVQQELLEVWRYFDPEEYAKRVLADAPLLDGKATLRHPEHVRQARHLTRLTSLHVVVGGVTDLEFLHGVPHLTAIQVVSVIRDFSALREHSDLERIIIYTPNAITAFSWLAALPRLKSLHFLHGGKLRSLNFLCHLPELRSLTLSGLSRVTDFSPLETLSALEDLDLRGPGKLQTLTHLAGLANLRDLRLERISIANGLPELAEISPQLQHIAFTQCDWVADLRSLQALRELQYLNIHECPVANLAPLRELRELRYVSLSGCERIQDLSSLANLPHLRELHLFNMASGLDLTPLAGRRLKIYLNKGQQVRGLEALGRHVKIIWW